MLNLNALSIPGVDFSAGTVTLSLWAAGVAAVLTMVLLAAAIFRAGSGAAVRVVGIAVAVVIAWVYFDRAAESDRAEERRALDQRLTLLTAQAINAGSILGCLDPNIGETGSPCSRTAPTSPIIGTRPTERRLGGCGAPSKQTASVSSPRCSQRATVAPPANAMRSPC